MRRTMLITGLAALAAIIVSAGGFGETGGTDRSSGPDAGSAASPLLGEGDSDGRSDAPDPGFVVHEWGTFTTFSGSDGVHLDFRPLDVDHRDLPPFVLDRANHSGPSGVPFAKSRIRARVRMETPVTYFYTDRQRTVRARVSFPEGLLTEFYPPVASISPPFDAKAAYAEGEPMGDSELDWGEITLIPLADLRPPLADAAAADWLQQRILQQVVPLDHHYGHYSHARNTDSALVHTHLPPQEGRFVAGHYIEKFLFYRGVGKFELPIHVRFEGEQPRMVNRGEHPLQSMILIRVDGEQMSMAVLPELAAGAEAPLPAPQTADVEQVAERVRQALVAEGLYEKEAAAMVRTWQDSWFTEQGMRLLYSVPGPVTERLLPLHIEPAPRASVRVLVGRIEILSPAQEQEMMSLVRTHHERRLAHFEDYQRRREQEGDAATFEPLPLPERLVEMDRFAEPALARVAAIAPQADIRAEAVTLIRQINSP